jgi:transposase
LVKGTSKNWSYRSSATKLPANDSALFPFRFTDVHSETVRDRRRNQFFEVPLNDEQWAKIERKVPMNRPGRKPQNNRRILSGILHVLRSGCRWQDCPPEYGPPTTIYNRFNRWSKRGIWQKIFETVAGAPDPVDEAALDSTHVKAHRCAGGGKGGPANRRSASPEAAATANSTPLSTNYAGPG